MNDADKSKLVELTRELMDRKAEKKRSNKDMADDIKATQTAIENLMKEDTLPLKF